MMTRIAPILLLAVASGVLAQSGVSAQGVPKPKADLIFTHGNIYTGVVDPASSLGAGKRAEALAVLGDRSLAVGARDEIMKLKGREPEMVDLHGHFVMPGINEAHMNVASRDPGGGKCHRDDAGTPNGILREPAQAAVQGVIPKPTHDKRRQAIELALADLASHGITSAQDNSEWEDFQIYEELEREGKLTARISEWLPFDDSIADLNRKRNSHPASDDMLHTRMLKGFMDGSLGSKTAALLEPYRDDAKK